MESNTCRTESPEYGLMKVLVVFICVAGLVVSGVGLLIAKELRANADARVGQTKSIEHQFELIQTEIEAMKSAQFNQSDWVKWKTEVNTGLDILTEKLGSFEKK